MPNVRATNSALNRQKTRPPASEIYQQRRARYPDNCTDKMLSAVPYFFPTSRGQEKRWDLERPGLPLRKVLVRCLVPSIVYGPW